VGRAGLENYGWRAVYRFWGPSARARQYWALSVERLAEDLLEVRSSVLDLTKLCSWDGFAPSAEELKTKSGKLFIKAVIAVSVYRKTPEGVSEEQTSFLPATTETR
jgi:hypothetical protein